MANNLASIFSHAAGVLKTQYAERDEGENINDEAVVLLIGNAEYHLPAIVGEIRYETHFDPTRGEYSKITRRDIRFNPADLETESVSDIPERSHIRIGEEEWPVDLTETEWGKLVVKVGVVRDVLSRLNTQERNGGPV